MKLESANRVRLIGRRKDDLRQMLESECFEDFEPIHLRHLNVEKDNVWFLFPDQRDGFRAVAAFAYDFDLVVLFQDSANKLASQQLIVRDQRPDLCFFHGAGSPSDSW